MQLPIATRGVGEVPLNGQKMRGRERVPDLGMMLHTNGQFNTKSKIRAEKWGKETSALLGHSWWSIGLSTAQISTIFNAYVRSKYRYGLMVVGVDEQIS